MQTLLQLFKSDLGQYCHGIIMLTLKAPVTTAADNIHKYFFIVFQRK